MEISADSPTRRSNASSSPEFEFWMMRNPPSFSPQLPLLSADELFAEGFLLPLHILSLNPSPNSSVPPPPPPAQLQAPLPEDPCLPPPSSKKWKDIFKSGEKKPAADKKDKKTFTATASTIAATEINMHIWPFSRSRSSGNSRPRSISSTTSRKTSSAPCSRCNSHGDSSKNAPEGTAAASASAPAAARKSAPTSSRTGGIYLGRSNPVWQLRRRNTAGEKKDIGPCPGKGRTFKLNVNTCITHQMPASCRECEKDGKPVLDDRSGGGGDVVEGGAGGELNGSLFNLRAIFNRKVSLSVRL